MTTRHAIIVAVALSIVIYNVLAFNLFRYLEFHHKQTWRQLGEPGIPWNVTPLSAWRTIRFIFFGGAFALWADVQVRVRMVLIWISAVAAIAAIALGESMGA